MKFISLAIIAILLQCSYSAYQLQRKNLFVMWEEFKMEYEKYYESEELEEKRLRSFAANLDLIDQLNLEADGQTEFGITQFADLSPDEFKSQVLMPPQAAQDLEATHQRKDSYNSIVDLPESFNWVDYGVVTSVKDQGSVGTCWAFSAVGNIEGQWKLAGNPLVSLSVEQVVDCSSNINPPNADCGVFGGWPYLAFEYVIQVGGLATDAAYPYCVGIGGSNACYPCSAPGFDEKLCGPGLYPPACNSEKWPCEQSKVQFTARISNWQQFSQDESILQQELISVGPLSALLNAATLQFYKKGIYAPNICNPKNLDHAVLITGYGITPSSDADNPSTEYWIVKNSWGTKWGQKGYFWIKRGVGQCGINQQVVSSQINGGIQSLD